MNKEHTKCNPGAKLYVQCKFVLSMCENSAIFASDRSSRRLKALKPCIKLLRRGGGFSLIELTIALGIVGFALVAILGLVPVGMKAFQDAMRLNVEAEIVQTVARELENTPWKRPTESGLPGASGGVPNGLADYLSSYPLYFDDEGREIGSGPTPPSGEKRATYAVFVVVQPTSVQGGTIATAGGGAGAVNLLYSAQIFVAYRRIENLESRVGTGTIAAADRAWIKCYPVLLGYRGF